MASFQIFISMESERLPPWQLMTRLRLRPAFAQAESRVMHKGGATHHDWLTYSVMMSGARASTTSIRPDRPVTHMLRVMGTWVTRVACTAPPRSARLSPPATMICNGESLFQRSSYTEGHELGSLNVLLGSSQACFVGASVEHGQAGAARQHGGV